MIHKGRIHWEIRDFWEIFWDTTKSDDELRWEIRENDRYRKRTQRQIHGIKNHSIWIKIHGEIDEQIREKFLKRD